jgi:hypothetical protein
MTLAMPPLIEWCVGLCVIFTFATAIACEQMLVQQRKHHEEILAALTAIARKGASR